MECKIGDKGDSNSSIKLQWQWQWQCQCPRCEYRYTTEVTWKGTVGALQPNNIGGGLQASLMGEGSSTTESLAPIPPPTVHVGAPPTLVHNPPPPVHVGAPPTAVHDPPPPPPIHVEAPPTAVHDPPPPPPPPPVHVHIAAPSVLPAVFWGTLVAIGLYFSISRGDAIISEIKKAREGWTERGSPIHLFTKVIWWPYKA